MTNSKGYSDTEPSGPRDEAVGTALSGGGLECGKQQLRLFMRSALRKILPGVLLLAAPLGRYTSVKL